ncbi:hypothetical protein HPP92_016034 [Vanilla planifolia]|uniref:Uncharacterized protein n=1 Tax=Vanilla planifolia TaxID=51239 RepID=A0A835URP9_VANPL|nr:hypothetical protein HPP92_016034 [Vanilla planifolia]
MERSSIQEDELLDDHQYKIAETTGTVHNHSWTVSWLLATPTPAIIAGQQQFLSSLPYASELFREKQILNQIGILEKKEKRKHE